MTPVGWSRRLIRKPTGIYRRHQRHLVVDDPTCGRRMLCNARVQPHLIDGPEMLPHHKCLNCHVIIQKNDALRMAMRLLGFTI